MLSYPYNTKLLNLFYTVKTKKYNQFIMRYISNKFSTPIQNNQLKN